MSVHVDLYGIARLRAGTATVEVAAETLGELLRELGARHPELEGEVIRDGKLEAGWLFGLEGLSFTDDPDAALMDGARYVLISAQAGG